MISKDVEGSNCGLFQGSIPHAPRGTEVNHEHLRIVGVPDVIRTIDLPNTSQAEPTFVVFCGGNGERE
jgi:hypothetical protein